ncbi:MAG TPA: FecR domain-containing protein [Polyangiaceae bacterium]
MTRKSPERDSVYARTLAEVKRNAPDELDWKLVESRLLARLDRDPVRPPVRRGHWLGVGVAAGVALAAAVMLLVMSVREPAPQPSADVPVLAVDSGTLTNAATVDSDTLTEGRRFVAGAAGTSVKQPGLAEWLLTRGSSAEVKALHPAVVIQLQAGTLQAEVVPSAAPESFVVEVGGLRVAVHGTVFSVTREGDDALVRVSEGVVSVGRVGQEPTTLLRAPASARFAATGARAGVHHQRRGNVSVVDAGALPPTASVVEELDASAELSLPKEPTFESVERGLAATEDGLRACLREHAAHTGSVKLSLHTRVTLKVDADGTLDEYRFVPPLAPAMHACVDRWFDDVRFSQSEVGALVIRDLEIER